MDIIYYSNRKIMIYTFFFFCRTIQTTMVQIFDVLKIFYIPAVFLVTAFYGIIVQFVRRMFIKEPKYDR